jgi:hypothetical protein
MGRYSFFLNRVKCGWCEGVFWLMLRGSQKVGLLRPAEPNVCLLFSIQENRLVYKRKITKKLKFYLFKPPEFSQMGEKQTKIFKKPLTYLYTTA